MLPPVRGGSMRPEPQLLTHREPEHDYGPGPDDDEPGFESSAPSAMDERRRRKKKIWRRIRRTLYVTTALMIIGPIIAFFVAYQMVDVPTPQQVVEGQGAPVVLKYSDGSELTKIAAEGATMVTYKQIGPTMLHAAYAAEDATFETNDGFDITGILRAGWNQVTAGTGGGSTITQQYIKKATEHEEKTLTRKATEIVKAYKMNNTYNKEDIITAYLNTIYFGRGATGVQAAAQAYYKKDVGQLAPAEAAFIAGVIQSPARSANLEYTTRRWNFVMDQMVKNGWLSAADRQAAKYPTPLPKDDTKINALTGPKALIQREVLNEVQRETGLSPDEVQELGLTIETTIDPRAQQVAEESVASVMKGQPDNLRPALVAVDPNTGSVRAYYGGTDGVGLDWAQVIQEPGSSFKAFDLVAFLEQGKGLGETFDGTSGRDIGGRPVRNAGGKSECGKECTVAKAMELSVNTVFYDMVLNTTGTKSVRNAAYQAGVAKKVTTFDKEGTEKTKELLGGEDGPNPDANISLGGGQTQVRTVDMAAAYSSFANGGTRRAPHLVNKVLNANGSARYEWHDDAKPAFDATSPEMNGKIARNVTEALLAVPKHSNIECKDAKRHQCAGKTGTQQYDNQLNPKADQNSKAWMVGYTPSISSAVSMSAQTNEPIKNAKGQIVFGSGLPGQIWKTFMDAYLAPIKDEPDWPKFDPIGKQVNDPGNIPSQPGSQTESTVPSTQSSSQTETSTTGDTSTTTKTKPTRPTNFPTFPEPGPGGPGGGGRGNGGLLGGG